MEEILKPITKVEVEAVLRSDFDTTGKVNSDALKLLSDWDHDVICQDMEYYTSLGYEVAKARAERGKEL
jgi:hypothetical protein